MGGVVPVPKALIPGNEGYVGCSSVQQCGRRYGDGGHYATTRRARPRCLKLAGNRRISPTTASSTQAAGSSTATQRHVHAVGLRATLRERRHTGGGRQSPMAAGEAVS